MRHCAVRALVQRFPFRGNKNVTLELRWNIIPNTGYLHLVRGYGSRHIDFPDQYDTTTKVKRL